MPPSAPSEYTRAVQGYPIENSGQYQPVEVPSPFGIPPLSGVSSPLGFPLGDSGLYEGQYQAEAAVAAHPNQPVIIINNGDYGTRKEKSGLFGGDGGDLLALLFATHAHHGHQAAPPEPLPPPPPYLESGERNASGPININITIIIPKSESESSAYATGDD